MVNPVWTLTTMVEPCPWYHGRFCHGAPILVTLVKLPEVDKRFSKSGSMINNHMFTYMSCRRKLTAHVYAAVKNCRASKSRVSTLFQYSFVFSLLCCQQINTVWKDCVGNGPLCVTTCQRRKITLQLHTVADRTSSDCLVRGTVFKSATTTSGVDRPRTDL